jgi:IS30 family transposase
VLTMTADNGTEFSSHQVIAAALEADFFFAKPYHS